MRGKRQRDEDWDDGQRGQAGDRREQRPDDRRANAYWDEARDWAGNEAGERQGFGDPGRPGPGGPGRPGFRDTGFGDSGFGDSGFGNTGWPDPQPPRGHPGYGSDPGFAEQGFAEPGYGGARNGGPRQDSQWQPESRARDPRRPPRDFPDAGYGQPGYGDRNGDYGGDYRRGDRRDGGQWGDPGGWGTPAAEQPMFTPSGAPAPQADPFDVPFPPNGTAGPRPYGRLLIFTLLDDRVAEFDRLAGQAAEGVRVYEPDTLVYVMHVVPKAPMQRIIYEIYRDHAAFENHQRQPHTRQFEEERRSCVLATNIIDLRLKFAKVAPLQGATLAAPGQPAFPGKPPLGLPPAPADAQHRRPQPAHEPAGAVPADGWFGDPAGGPRGGGRPAGANGEWATERLLNGAERRSQDWEQTQRTASRHRGN
jgi:quinol monooxygenase YgiN